VQTGPAAPHKARSHLTSPPPTPRSYRPPEDAAARPGQARDAPIPHAPLAATLLTPTAAHLLLGRFLVARRHRYLA